MMWWPPKPTKTSQPSSHSVMLLFKNKHIKWFMGSDSKQYEEHGMKMWQHLCAKFLDQDDEDKVYDRLLCPKMTTDETPLDNKLIIKQALRAANAKNLHISLCQVIKAAGNGLDPNRYQAIMDSYTTENKTFTSLDMMVDILEKYHKTSHVKASCKAQSKSKSSNNNTKASTNTTLGTMMPSSVPTLNPQEMKALEGIHKINKRKKCIICCGNHYANNCEILKSLGYTCSFTRPNNSTPFAIADDNWQLWRYSHLQQHSQWRQVNHYITIKYNKTTKISFCISCPIMYSHYWFLPG